MLRQGDVLVVWRLDRLGRSLRHLIEFMTELEGEGVGFQSITEAIDTTTPAPRRLSNDVIPSGHLYKMNPAVVSQEGSGRDFQPRDDGHHVRTPSGAAGGSALHAT